MTPQCLGGERKNNTQQSDNRDCFLGDDPNYSLFASVLQKTCIKCIKRINIVFICLLLEEKKGKET